MPELPSSLLPSGGRHRPVTVEDAPAVHRLIAACERDLHGRVETGVDRVVADLTVPGLEPARDTLLVEDGAGTLVGWAWVRGRRSVVDVHPGYRGRGLGGALLTWAEARAREAGGDRLAQTVPDRDLAAATLLRSRGYADLVSEWLLEYDTSAEPAVPAPPAGVTVRPFRPGDERAAHQVAEDAFDEWQPRRKPYEEWARHTVERSTFAPEASPVALAGGRLVGVVLSMDVPAAEEGYVQVVAVHRDHRNRGVARLLLHEAFRVFHRRGRTACTLATHSETGALSLYKRLGMTVRHSSTVCVRALTG
jgi:mycothiol synthase